MLRLLKYELRKTMMSKLILLGITLVAEAVFLAGLWGNRENTLAIGAVLLFFIALTGIAIMGILSVATLHKDMNTRQGYMLFMTPNSTYRILGAKVAENGLSMLGIGAVGLALCLLDFSLIKQELKFITTFLENFGIGLTPTFPHLAALLAYIICSILCSVTTAYLADVISSSLLNGQKGNMVITFALFALLNFGIQKIMGLVPSSLGIVTVFLLQSAIALVLATVMYIITARLMDRYLSV